MTSVLAEHPDYESWSDDDFRRHVRAFVEAEYPEHLRYPVHRLHHHEIKDWFDKLVAKGWLAPGWPREHGGMGLSAAKRIVMIEEFERHGCSRVSDQGVTMIGPLLMRYGSEAQRRFFLPAILAGEHIWCQGYSEPNAGSDLAGLRTEAVDRGDHWLVNGQKIWTTLATDANWIYLLVRTDKAAKKQEGISFLLVPMSLPGVTVRPIVTIGMHDDFCEVFFDNVKVPKENLVGEVNRGWTMAKALLEFERIFLGSPAQSSYALTRLRRLADHLGLADDPAFRDRYARLALDLADHVALYELYVEQLRRGEPLGPDVSMLKVNQSELYQRITRALVDIAGEHTAFRDGSDDTGGVAPAAMWVQSMPVTIYGGSSEVQRNVIAKYVLDLPS